MKKISNSKAYIIIITILLCIVVAFIIRHFFNKKEVQAFVSPLEIYHGEVISYTDSTFNAKKWMWEFGNGDTSFTKTGEYKYKDIGLYRIRLTVDNSYQKEFVVNVKDPVRLERDSLVRIEAPSMALQEELIVFRGIGLSKEWRWSFGETGIIDSRDQVALYTYLIPGIHEVELMTEETKYPVRHQIEILPKYIENDTTDVWVRVGNDIKEKLQAIVDGKPFNPNYNHILTKYLCNDPYVLVTVNNEKKNDFYSYCQGLKILGKHNTTILAVAVEPDEKNPDCLLKLFVSQVALRDY